MKNKSAPFVFVAAAWLAGCAPEPPTPPATFAGSSACAACHRAEHDAWRSSQHAVAMQEASETTVLGRFDGTEFTSGGVTSRFLRRDGRYLVRTDGPDGQPAEFEVKYTFGVYPLQQYLVPTPGGRLQALGIAWDARPSGEGGQRWFHLYPGQDIRAGNPLHWTGIDQNWNYQCADCHSTNVRKNYDPATGGFDTTWSEISVGCEACHGPASNHVVWARREPGWRALETSSGLTIALDERRDVRWTAGASGTAARSVRRTTSREIDTCARCHARRGQFADDIHAGGNWLDAFRPALLEPLLYHADGQQRDEVYTWGSFLQSRMHAAGVTCADCHDPHTQKLRAPGNAVCGECHQPSVFDTTAHHRHASGSTGAECAACHMPTTTYMVVDPRHDHSLRIPRPDRSAALGTPDACINCHTDRDAAWAAMAVAGWYPQRKTGFQEFAESFARAERGDPAATDALRALIVDATKPALVRASAIARSADMPSPELLAAVARSLTDPDAVIRATAAEAIARRDAAARVEELAPLLADPVRSVRMAAARAIAGEPESRLLADERPRFVAALEEWMAAQRFNADRPEAQTNLGTLQLERGAIDEAISAFQKAVSLDPTFVQASVNLADAYRAQGKEVEAENALRGALVRNPGVAAVHHALGLTLVRQARMPEALGSLRTAHELDPASSRFAYVYAVALHDAGERQPAIAVLREALAAHPYDADLRSALTAYTR